jgi:hypothetical protein
MWNNLKYKIIIKFYLTHIIEKDYIIDNIIYNIGRKADYGTERPKKADKK